MLVSSPSTNSHFTPWPLTTGAGPGEPSLTRTESSSRSTMSTYSSPWLFWGQYPC